MARIDGGGQSPSPCPRHQSIQPQTPEPFPENPAGDTVHRNQLEGQQCLSVRLRLRGFMKLSREAGELVLHEVVEGSRGLAAIHHLGRVYDQAAFCLTETEADDCYAVVVGDKAGWVVLQRL